ncbi:MAG: FTR1 family iron permease [Planctomycetes bacterium]|nr:FTR1 family iron permease [Planctomycetota bacterium]
MKTLAFVLMTSLAAVASNHDAEVADLRSHVDAAAARMAAGDADGAAGAAVRGFRAFEDTNLHNALAAKDNDLYKKLETDWLDLVEAYEGGDAAAAASRREALNADFEAARKLFAEPVSPRASAVNAFVILFREGFEALLILGAIIATLRKLGRRDMGRVVWGGAAAAVGASFGLYFLSLSVLRISGAGQEILEGVTMLIAAAVLFWMSYWLISKIEGRRWQQFIQDNVKAALSRGSAVGIASLSFLVVFREGFETVLMIRALEMGGAGWGAILAGLGVASVLLVGVFAAIIVAGLKLPIRAFFAGTSAIMLALVFKFSGDGILELQEGGAVGRHPVGWIPDGGFLATWLGVHPTVEGVALQAVVLAVIAAGLAWTFLRKSAPPVPKALPVSVPAPVEVAP